MPRYRLYCLDGKGSITSAEWLKADSDEQALQVARDLRKGVMCEIWRRERLIGKLTVGRQWSRALARLAGNDHR